MSALLRESGYVHDLASGVWLRPDYAGIAYSDGDEAEARIASVIREAQDLSVLSMELRRHCTDWPSLYHLSSMRANLLRPFGYLLDGDILEIGAGCGAITRYLGECGASVLALEGSPRRAAAARSRTRDLANVTVLAEKFDQFQCDRRFDFITLIGVLEYASQFEFAEVPPLAMLARARSLLKPDGRLILAIENQLGLKYFAGAPEDHLGQPMVGIEGRYCDRQPQTFGRKVLSGLLQRAGFPATEFLVPFPDYKLPVSIIAEAAFTCPDFDAAALAWQSARRDPQLPEHCTFSLELAWPQVVLNDLGVDLANSFLVVASAQRRTRSAMEVLAWHYSVERIPGYCKETAFVRRDTGDIQVVYRRLGQPAEQAGDGEPAPLSFVCPDSETYAIGKPLALEFIGIVTADGWIFEHVARFVWRYLSIVEAIGRKVGLDLSIAAAGETVPGDFFDLIPQNIIVREDGMYVVIDKEWQLAAPIEVGHLLFRSLLGLIGSISRFGRPSAAANMTNRQFVDATLAAAGLPLQEADFERYLRREAQIQQHVTGREMGPILARWQDQPLPTEPWAQAITNRDAKLAWLEQAMSGQDQRLASADMAVAERDTRIAALNAALTGREAQIELINRMLADRDATVRTLELNLVDQGRRIEGLQLALAEQERQVAQLHQSGAEREQRIGALEREVSARDARLIDLDVELAWRDRQIANLRAAVAGLETQNSELLASNSWRLTAPLRAARRMLVSRPYAGFRKLASDALRRAWADLPVASACKQRFKDRLFRRLPRLFSWSTAYRRWRNFRGEIGVAGMPPLGRGAPSQRPASAAREPEFVPLLDAPAPVQVPVRLIAFYLPQYHTIPENDQWWGAGFTEWTNVRPARPQFVGHYQPRIPGELGYYDLLDPGVQRRQVELAQRYGIGGFCFYFYWFGGRTLLEQPVRNYLEDASLTLPFCLCWANENWTRSWDGLDNEILIGQEHSAQDDLAFIEHVSRYFKDERYIRICAKPLLIVYRPSQMPDARHTASRWRRWCRDSGIGEIYLAYAQSFEAVDPRKFGFDAAIEFPPNNSSVPDVTGQVQPLHENFSCTVYDWRAFVQRSRQYKEAAYKLFRTVCPSWDNTARRRNRSSVLLDSSPCGYQEWLYNAISDTCRRQSIPDERLVFVNAWNEWAEGAHLEPDRKYGYAYLEASRMALVRSRVDREVGRVDRRQTVAIVIHAFYQDVFQEILEYLGRLTSIPFKLYVTCTDEDVEIVDARLSAAGHAFHLLPGPNRGRDALPFLNVLPTIVDSGHDLIVKIHTKKSVHRQDGDAWRRELFDELLTDSSIQAAFDHFLAHPDSGILGPDGHVVPMSYYWGSNAQRVLHYAERLGIEHDRVESLRFVAGHMFIARSAALIPLLNLAIDEQCFETEQGQTDGTMAHAIERIVSVSAEASSLVTRSTTAGGRTDRDYPYARRVSTEVARNHG